MNARRGRAGTLLPRRSHIVKTDHEASCVHHKAIKLIAATMMAGAVRLIQAFPNG